MRRRVPALLCILLMTAVVAGTVPVSAQPASEETRLEAQLQADGDARWTIVATVPLENESDVENFRSFADAFEAGERDFQLGVDTFERAASEASEASGREMEVHSTNREATIVNETEDGEVVSRYGELRVSFTWGSFARIGENGTLYVDDAFNTTSGTWLPGLEEGQTLVIRSPPGYGGPSTSPIGAEDGDLTWHGPQTFEPGYFEIEYPPRSSGPGPETGLSTYLLAGSLLLSGGALLLGGYLVLRRRGTLEDVGGDVVADAESTSDASNGRESQAAAAAAAGGESSGEAPDPELLSDEERVEYLLERNGGRMKQANIVKETGWSNAKVSQLLSSMAEEGRVDKLRIGRENLISLPGEGIDDLAAETDDE